jgi:GWxTD domain-containing protein
MLFVPIFVSKPKNMRKIFTLFLFLSLGYLHAKSTNIFISYEQFMTDQSETYLELYFGISSNSLDYIKKEETFQGGVEITVSILQDSNIVTGDRFRILSPAFTDTASLTELLMHQQRFILNPGDYQMQLTIQDINEPTEKYDLEQKITIDLEPSQAGHSEIIFLEDYYPVNESDPDVAYARSGYALFPIISNGTRYYPESIDKLSFYCELYNLNELLGDSTPYLLRYYLQSDDSGEPLQKYASFSKKRSSTIEPVLASFDISNLPNGNYNLVIEAMNREGEVVLDHSVFFYRQNEAREIVSGFYEEKEITGSFVDFIGNLDSIYRFTEYLYPISTQREQDLQTNLLKQADETLLKRYFLAFWEQKKPLDPQGAWEAYYRKVRFVNREYASSLRPGYKSDRGRVYLTYGVPSRVDRREKEPEMPPYEIWQYDQINTPFAPPQNNRIFIFGEFDPSTSEYQLFHSTAIGELQSRNWRQDLFYRAYGGPGSIDPANDQNDRRFGSRAYQNIILNSTGSDRISR